MKTFAASLVGLLFLSFAFDADARRMGGARNLGTQREAVTPQPAPKAPAQQQSQQQAAQQPAQAGQPAAGGNKWLGPLAGLALGAGLFALFFNNGLAGLLAGLAVLALILAAAVYVARTMRGKTAQAPLQYAGAGADGVPPSAPAALPGGAAPHSVAATSRFPDSFDAAEFVRHARLNFVRLQEAHDKGDVATLGDFLTPELAREIEADIAARGGATQHTDVVTLNAEVLEVATEAGRYIVSVRFEGLIRETAGAEPEAFSEIWHLEKPLKGRGGWLVAGIQQVQ